MVDIMLLVLSVVIIIIIMILKKKEVVCKLYTVLISKLSFLKWNDFG